MKFASRGWFTGARSVATTWRVARLDRLRTTMRRRAFAICLLLGAFASPCARSESAADHAADEQEQALQTRLTGLALQKSRSADLRLRILYSIGYGIDDEPGPDGKYHVKATWSARALVEQARGSTDPMVLDLLLVRCEIDHPNPGCDRRDLALRWTQSDTQNQVAWLALAAVLRDDDDANGARAAFRRAALASRWHEHRLDIARLVATTIPRDLTPRESLAALIEAFAKADMNSTLTALQLTWAYCKDNDPDMRDACGRIVRTMARDADTLQTLHMTIRYGIKAGLEPTTIALYQERDDAAQWVFPVVFGASFGDPTDAEFPARIARARALLAVGERQRVIEVLREQRLTEAEAARRHVARLSQDEIAQRRRVLAGG